MIFIAYDHHNSSQGARHIVFVLWNVISIHILMKMSKEIIILWIDDNCKVC